MGFPLNTAVDHGEAPEALAWRGAQLAHMVHTGGRGYVSFSGPDAAGEWRDVLVPVRQAIAAAASLEGQPDRYLSVAQFRGGHRRLADRVMSFGASACEIDWHAGPPCDPERLWPEIRAYLKRINVPLPSVVVASGRGLHLWWPYQLRIPGRAAPRWRALQSALVDRLKRFGADPTCVDAARVLRLPGTINSKAGSEARIISCSDAVVNFEDLFAAVVPFGRLELKRRRETAKVARETRAAGMATKPARSKAPWPVAAVDDLRHLARHRNGFRRGLERNNACFIAATMLAQSATNFEAYIAAAVAFGRETTDLTDWELRAAARSAWRKLQQDGKGYLYSRARIIKLLGITSEEASAAGMAVLVPGRSAADARASNAERQRAYRLRRGARPRAQSFEQAKPWRVQGISRATWYARRAAPRPVRQAPGRHVGLFRNAITWRSPMQGRDRHRDVAQAPVLRPDLALGSARGPSYSTRWSQTRDALTAVSHNTSPSNLNRLNSSVNCAHSFSSARTCAGRRLDCPGTYMRRLSAVSSCRSPSSPASITAKANSTSISGLRSRTATATGFRQLRTRWLKLPGGPAWARLSEPHPRGGTTARPARRLRLLPRARRGPRVTEVVTANRSRRRWLPWAGGLLGVAALAWVLRGFDLDRFLAVLAGADARFVALVPLAIMGEQFVRAWKWRQLLSPLRPIGTLYLFGTIMAGYLLAVLVPFGFGTIARSWLVARRENLKLASVLATVALDRLTDGIVFACLVPIALLSVVFPDPTGDIRAGLIWGSVGSFGLFGLAFLALVGYRRGTLAPDGRLARLLMRLPPASGNRRAGSQPPSRKGSPGRERLCAASASWSRASPSSSSPRRISCGRVSPSAWCSSRGSICSLSSSSAS